MPKTELITLSSFLGPLYPLLTEFAAGITHHWAELVNQTQTDAVLESFRSCIARGQPFGSGKWINSPAEHLGLESKLRAAHRPKKTPA